MVRSSCELISKGVNELINNLLPLRAELLGLLGVWPKARGTEGAEMGWCQTPLHSFHLSDPISGQELESLEGGRHTMASVVWLSSRSPRIERKDLQTNLSIKLSGGVY